jgi:quercetin dioxygenase-like cupin family protein
MQGQGGTGSFGAGLVFGTAGGQLRTVHGCGTQIKKSGMTPTITSLMKVAAALGKSVSYFADEDEASRPVTVVRTNARSPLYTSKHGLELEKVSGRRGPFSLAGAEAHIEPIARSGPRPVSHPGEGLVFMPEGRMTFTIDGESRLLETGDSIHLRAVRPQSWANPDNRPARAVWLAVRSQ